jgi:hypothetical protein
MANTRNKIEIASILSMFAVLVYACSYDGREQAPVSNVSSFDLQRLKTADEAIRSRNSTVGAGIYSDHTEIDGTEID